MKSKELKTKIKEAKKNPSFLKEINEFIKASTKIYNLK